MGNYWKWVCWKISQRNCTFIQHNLIYLWEGWNISGKDSFDLFDDSLKIGNNSEMIKWKLCFFNCIWKELIWIQSKTVTFLIKSWFLQIHSIQIVKKVFHKRAQFHKCMVNCGFFVKLRQFYQTVWLILFKSLFHWLIRARRDQWLLRFFNYWVWAQKERVYR